MDRPLHEQQVRIVVLEPLDGAGTSMRRAVVDDPENRSRPAIGVLAHELIDKPGKGSDSGLGFAANKDFGRVDVQGGQIGPTSQLFVSTFMG
jgi:hypothetical protein